MTYSIQQAYLNGIEGLHMGGEILGDSYYREKDILEDDYSSPTLSGDLPIFSISPLEKYYVVDFGDCKLILTHDELNAGIKGE